MTEKWIAGYKIEKEIGSGSMGTCHHVSDPTNPEDHYCLKTTKEEIDNIPLNPRNISFLKEGGKFAKDYRSPKAMALRFQLEIHYLIELQSSSGIPNIYNWGNTHSSQIPDAIPHGFLLCELIPGKSLRDILREREQPLPLQQILSIGQQVSTIAQKAHEQNILHRDIKPQNILWKETEERASLVDWGLGAYLDPQTKRLLNPETEGHILGTPAFFAPEQADGCNKDVGIHSDIFNIGGTLYNLLSKKPLYTGNDAWYMLNKAEFVDFDELPTNIPKIVRDLVGKHLI